jgi:parallel beta-helix repeat protein
VKIRTALQFVLLLSFNGLVMLSSTVKLSRATGSIYIRANGSIDPSTAPISNVGNMLYTLAGNISDSLVVERDNIVVDGTGYTLHGSGSGTGIDLAGKQNVTIRNIRVTGFHYGIYLYGSIDTTIFNTSLIRNEWDGLFLLNSDSNLIYGNTFLSNKRYGVALSESGNNKIFHNNFIDNANQTHQYESFNNVWNDGYLSGGNYWSDYTGVDLYSGLYQNESGNDGIGDTPHTVNIFNEDNYPLIAPISLFDVGTWNSEPCKVEIVSNSTVFNFQLNTIQKTLSFNVTTETGSGFCRATIPNILVENLWQSNYTVLVDGEKPLDIRNWTDDANAYTYFTYLHREHRVIIIPEFPSITILSLLMVPLTTAIVIVKRRYQRKPEKPS